MTLYEALVASRKKIENPENWMQGALARDANGALVEPASKRAVCWCAIGAIQAAAWPCDYPVARKLETYIEPLLVDEFNDSSTHDQVLALFDRAIKDTRP